MIRLLGPPPLQLLDRANKSVYSEFFSDQGTIFNSNGTQDSNDFPSLGEFRHQHLLPSEEFTFSNLTPFLHGEDKQLFLQFVKKMLQWEPEQRSTAAELYNDPWLDFKA